MNYLLAGVALFFLVRWGWTRSAWLRSGGAQILSGALAVALFAGAAFWAVRGGWAKAGLLVMFGIGLALSARRTGGASRSGPASGETVADQQSGMGAAQARSLLGLADGATVEEVRAAHGRLIRMAHPDRGGTDGLAAQLNAARDCLIRNAGR